MRAKTMLRPVGSRVPRPARGQAEPLPWEDQYHTWCMGSGTEALSAAIMLAIRRSELNGAVPQVILPAYGCPDLVAAVVAQGASPVLVDLMPDRPVMDLEKLVQAISGHTIAVIAAGFLGVPERLAELGDICRSRGLWLVEDSAQCFPPDCSHKPIADCAVLSFGRGKPINLMGCGALLVREDHQRFAGDVLEKLPETAVTVDWKWMIRRQIFNLLLGRIGYGLLLRLPFIGLGSTVYKPLESIRRVDLPLGLLGAGIRNAQSRPSVASQYSEALSFLVAKGWTLFMADQRAGADRPSVTLRYGLLAPDRMTRNLAVSLLNGYGIGANAFYEKTLPGIDVIADVLPTNPAVYPNAASFAERLLTLPSHEDVSDRDITVVVTVLDKVTREPEK